MQEGTETAKKHKICEKNKSAILSYTANEMLFNDPRACMQEISNR